MPKKKIHFGNPQKGFTGLHFTQTKPIYNQALLPREMVLNEKEIKKRKSKTKEN